jgi:hypothetical protein
MAAYQRRVGASTSMLPRRDASSTPRAEQHHARQTELHELGPRCAVAEPYSLGGVRLHCRRGVRGAAETLAMR